MESAADALRTSTRRGAGLRRRKATIRFGAGLALVVAVVALSVGAIAQQRATPPSGAAGAIIPAPATAPAVDNHTPSFAAAFFAPTTVDRSHPPASSEANRQRR